MAPAEKRGSGQSSSSYSSTSSSSSASSSSSSSSDSRGFLGESKTRAKDPIEHPDQPGEVEVYSPSYSSSIPSSNSSSSSAFDSSSDSSGLVLVDFILVPQGYGKTTYCSSSTTLLALRNELTGELGLGPNALLLQQLRHLNPREDQLINETRPAKADAIHGKEASDEVPNEDELYAGKIDTAEIELNHVGHKKNGGADFFSPASSRVSLPLPRIMDGVLVFDELDINATLSSYGLLEGSEAEIVLSVNTTVDAPEESLKLHDHPSNSIRHIEIFDADGISRVIRMEIEFASEPKPFLGGFRRRANGLTFLHASTQTPGTGRRTRRHGGTQEQSTRATQTAQSRSLAVQDKRTAATQTMRRGLYQSTKDDVWIAPSGHYVTSNEYHLLVSGKVLVLQRHVRGMLARRRFAASRRAAAAAAAKTAEAVAAAAASAAAAEVAAVKRRAEPRTEQDFVLLKAEVERWHQTRQVQLQTKHARLINAEQPGDEDDPATTIRRLGSPTSGLGGSSRRGRGPGDSATVPSAIPSSSPSNSTVEKEKKENQVRLLREETKLLQAIDKLKLSAKQRTRAVKIDRVLTQMAGPRVWFQSDGRATSVDTPKAKQARELKALYTRLRSTSAEGVVPKDRLAVLLEIKRLLEQYPTKTAGGGSPHYKANNNLCSRSTTTLEKAATPVDFAKSCLELSDLVTREADLLQRGRPFSSLNGLRQRLENLFLALLSCPQVNPAAAQVDIDVQSIF
eukprot:GHVT01030356.1.p1 GENE.GHVT01030356.1~~GHVT01030356.1.p1  ORF type:complete len:738 (+),score=93.11 GHVT01030356.1:1184-3397(+)